MSSNSTFRRIAYLLLLSLPLCAQTTQPTPEPGVNELRQEVATLRSAIMRYETFFSRISQRLSDLEATTARQRRQIDSLTARKPTSALITPESVAGEWRRQKPVEPVTSVVSATPYASLPTGRTQTYTDANGRRKSLTYTESGGAIYSEFDTHQDGTTTRTRSAPVRRAQQVYHTGPRGGCFYYTGSGRKEYVDRSLCR